VVLEPLQAMHATCTDGVRGVRHRALLLLAWSGGGRLGLSTLEPATLRKISLPAGRLELGTA